MIRPKVLLITLPVNSYGGVVSYNNGVLQSDNIDIIQFRNYSGKYDNFILKTFFLIIDIFRLSIKLITKNINIVHISPSLSFNSFLRDSASIVASMAMIYYIIVN